MKTSATSVVEALHWADLFGKFTGLSVINSMSIYAELCFCWNTSKVLQNILLIEEAMDEFHEDYDLDEDEGAYWEAMNEIFSIHGVDYADSMDEEDIEEVYEHYAQVLDFHNLSGVCLEHLIESLNPIKEGDEWTVPSIQDQALLWTGEFNAEPYYDEDPEEIRDVELGEEIENAMRLARPMHPAGWIGLIRHLGLQIVEGSIDEDYRLGKPSFYISDIPNPLPVFLAAPSRIPFSTDDNLCEDIKRFIVEENTADCVILFYSSPLALVKDGSDEQLQFWGEILINERWYELILRPESTNIDVIIADAISTSRGMENIDWAQLSTRDNSLMDVWARENVDLLFDILTPPTEASIH